MCKCRANRTLAARQAAERTANAIPGPPPARVVPVIAAASRPTYTPVAAVVPQVRAVARPVARPAVKGIPAVVVPRTVTAGQRVYLNHWGKPIARGNQNPAIVRQQNAVTVKPVVAAVKPAAVAAKPTPSVTFIRQATQSLADTRTQNYLRLYATYRK